MTEAAPAIGFSVSVQIDEKRSIVAQTHIDQHSSLTSINEVLDKIRTAVDRQKLISDLDTWRIKLEHDEKKIAQLKEDFVRIDERHKAAWEAGNRRGEYKPDAKVQSERQNALSTLDRYEQEIGLDKENIAKCEARLREGPHLKVA